MRFLFFVGGSKTKSREEKVSFLLLQSPVFGTLLMVYIFLQADKISKNPHRLFGTINGA